MKIPVRFIQDENGNKTEVVIPYDVYENRLRPLLDAAEASEQIPELSPMNLGVLSQIRERLKDVTGLNLSQALEEEREDRI